MIVCHPNREVFLRQNENELLQISSNVLSYSKLTMEEWKTNLPIADDKSIVTKKADNRSCVEVWDRNKNTSKAEKQLDDEDIYKNVSSNKKIPSDYLRDYLNSCVLNLVYVIKKVLLEIHKKKINVLKNVKMH